MISSVRKPKGTARAGSKSYPISLSRILTPIEPIFLVMQESKQPKDPSLLHTLLQGFVYPTWLY